MSSIVPLFWSSMLLTVLSNIGYHLCQKGIAAQANPLISLLVTYAVALSITLAGLPLFYPSLQLGAELRNLNWASYTLGIAAAGLELGFLLAYRAGWNLSIGALFSNVMVTLLLIPIGVFAYREALPARTVFGIALSLAGLLLMGKR